ncbi:MAG TPA: hypothetical protein VGS79_07960 [Puia sp.]|nr:hypothetical protein [Puia sp.]
MKSLFNAVFGRFVLGAMFVMTLATAHGQSAAAGDGQNEQATVKYLGTQDDMIVFNVAYANPGGNRFELTIKDQDGSMVYENSFTDKSFYKQFRLPKADKDRIFFVFHNNHDADVVKTFEVNVNSRFVHAVAIKKID